jgi:alpha-L-fucosidase
MKLKNLIVIFFLLSHSLFGQSAWKNPIIKQGRLGSPLVETSPFVFHGKLYLLENNQRFWDVKGAKPGDFFKEDEVRIRDVKTGKKVTVALTNHGFGTAFVWKDSLYVFAGNYGEGKPWRRMTEITMTATADLKSWTKPVTVLKANETEYFFNTAVTRGKDKFILLYETNDRRWKPFTFRYVESSDLRNWKEIPDGIYGKEKYVGGPALYYENGWYYTLYLEALKKAYETRITRSRDLVNWEDAPEGRPFVTFDPAHKNIPLLKPEITESNASDVELCYFPGKTILYFTGSDQTTAGDLQTAVYPGTPAQLFEHFYGDVKTDIPPKHEGNWTPVLIAPQNAATGDFTVNYRGLKPSTQQLELQERQLGAFVHFGPATYLKSDMLTVPAADLFNPSRLDAEQWVKTAKSFGAKHIVFTAKHHNGYCLWPTKTTDYSVVKSPWKNGKGDVVADFVNACRKYDVKIGLYVSAGDKHFPCSSTPDPQGKRKLVGDIHQYFPVFMQQLRELLTGYGEISYLWFDGAYDPFGWDVANQVSNKRLGTAYGDAIAAMVKDLQPSAVIMGGTKPDVRWSGSEQGWAAYPLWNVVPEGAGLEQWVGPQNSGWIPAEANIFTRNTWFWTPDSDKTLRTVDFLKKVYFESIGRGANLLINMTPDTSGLIPLAETARLADFGKSIQKTISILRGAKTTKQSGPEIELTLSGRQAVNLIEIEEDITEGQRVKQYEVQAFIGEGWKTVASGESIGRKRLQLFDPVSVSRLRLLLVNSPGAVIRKLAVYETTD